MKELQRQETSEGNHGTEAVGTKRISTSSEVRRGAVPRSRWGFEVKAKWRLPADPAEFTEKAKGKSEFTSRRFRIRKEDLETFGHTADCPGCRAVNRGTTATNQSEERRKRLA